MTKYLFRVSICLLAATAMTGVFATSALAYPESLANPSGLPYTGACTGCHGAQSSTQPTNTIASAGVQTDGSETGVNVGTRKGPHGGYTSGTQKCQTCHTIHDASGSVALLPEATIEATCETCHDGTGGGGVYGVVKARTGVDPGAQHRIETPTGAGGLKMVVPGGNDANGGSIETSFTGSNGSLTCTDCHSPHNSDTVKPFLGDRRRSTSDAATANTVRTNRLLKKRPTSGTSDANEYGSDWCESCHAGRHSGLSDVSNHPVADESDGFYYRKVERVDGYDSSTRSATATDLGGSNFGYVMPEPRGAQAAPICQQCHEDTRSVGDVNAMQIDTPSEVFVVNPDGLGGGNPQFQNFPHETQNPDFLIEQYDDLCLNCHTPPGG